MNISNCRCLCGGTKFIVLDNKLACGDCGAHYQMLMSWSPETFNKMIREEKRMADHVMKP